MNQSNPPGSDPNRIYWIIGAMTLVLLACIGAFTYLASTFIPQPTIEPTSTPLPPPVVSIQSIKSQAELSTVKYSTITEIYNETPPEGLIDEFLGTRERLLMLVYGDVQAGFDLAEMDEDDIWSDGKRVRLVLPPPKLLNSSIDFDRTHIVFYENNLIFDRNNPNLQGEALKQAVGAVEEAALEDGVLERANDYGKLHFENFLYSLGFTDVEVVVDGQIFRD